MKASKLVSELQEILNHQGDFEVRVDMGEDEEFELKESYKVVDVVPDFRYIWIVAR